MQPFDTARLCRFPTHWFDDDKDASRRFLDQIRRAHLDDLIHVPLLATIAAIIFEQHGERPLPDNRYDLYVGRVLAQELTDRGVTVNTILPTAIHLAAWGSGQSL